MARDYYNMACGHRAFDATNYAREDVCRGSLSGACDDCNEARIGQTISFVRYGAAPAGGLSRDHRDGVLLAGVSVYEVADGKRVCAGWDFGIASRKRPIYGTAKMVAWGPDGEPLVDWSTVVVCKGGKR